VSFDEKDIPGPQNSFCTGIKLLIIRYLRFHCLAETFSRGAGFYQTNKARQFRRTHQQMKFNVNSIKNLAVTSTLALSLAGFAAAQTTTESANSAGNTATQAQSGKNGLGLSADQKSQIKQIRQNQKQQIQAVKADNSL